MKKIPTLFEREFENHNVVKVLPNVTEGCEWVLNNEGIATIKLDGSCCAIIGGVLYKRYDAKAGKTPPDGAIPCCNPDAFTGHWPHWVKCNVNKPEDKWFFVAFQNVRGEITDGTYEAIGPHFNSNPYDLSVDIAIKHGQYAVTLDSSSMDSIHEFLVTNLIEGLVYWKDGEPKCKIKRSDFGLEWPIKRKDVSNG